MSMRPVYQFLGPVLGMNPQQLLKSLPKNPVDWDKAAYGKLVKGCAQAAWTMGVGTGIAAYPVYDKIHKFYPPLADWLVMPKIGTLAGGLRKTLKTSIEGNIISEERSPAILGKSFLQQTAEPKSTIISALSNNKARVISEFVADAGQLGYSVLSHLK